MTESPTFAVPAGALPWLDEKLAKLAKRAAKLGVEAPGYTVLSTETLVDDETGAVTVTHELVLHGGVVKLAGWQFLAALDVSDAGVLVRSLPGVELTTIERAAARATVGTCDHCRTIRLRKSTYLVRNETGQHAIVGSTCLADFTGHHNPEALAAWAEVLLDLEASLSGDSWGGAGGEPVGADQLVFLTYVATAVAVWGWRPQSACQFGEICTADLVWQALFGLGTRDREARLELQRARTPEHETTALLALAYAAEGAGGNDYQHNLAVSLGAPVTYRTKRIAASAVSSYLKQQARLALAAAERAASLDEWFGEVGKRLVLKLTFVSEQSFEGQYGVTWLTIFRDAEGRKAKWWGKGLEGEPKAGDVFEGKATVKAHETYQDRKETVLTRCALKAVEA